MSEVNGVLFDCDGVLVDSRDANVATFQNLLKKAGYKEPSREAVLACFHLPLRESVSQLTGVTDDEELDRIIELVKDPSVRATHLFKFPDEIDSTLEQVHARYKTGIVTSRIRVGLDDVLDARDLDLRRYFDVLVVKEDYGQPKPHPEALLLALKMLRLDASETVYIGDTHVDIEAARAAGMMSIHLAMTKHSDADVGVTGFAEIPKAVEKLSGRTAL